WNEDAALRELGESLTLARKIQDTSQQFVDLHHIASVYARLGDQTRALEFYRQALLDTAENSRARSASLRAMANILRQQGHAQEALKMDQETLSLDPTPRARPRILIQIAQDYLALGKSTEAAATIDSVLNQTAESNEVVRALALQERARMRAANNDL